MGTLIRYNNEEIIMETPTDTLEGDDNIFIPSFEISNIAYNDDNMYGVVYGDFQIFHDLNKDIDNNAVNYTIINNLPKNGIEYFANTKHGIPGNINEAIKYKTRSKIEHQVGDIYDLVADLSKRLTYSERLCIHMANELMNITDTPIPIVKSMYMPLVQAYLDLHNTNDNVSSMADLEDPYTLFQKLFTREVTLTTIVSEDYLTKKI